MVRGEEVTKRWVTTFLWLKTQTISSTLPLPCSGSIFLPIVETINSSHPFCVESYLEQLRLDQKTSSVSAVNHHSFGFGRRSCPAGIWAERNLSFLLCKMVENFHLDLKEEKKKRIQSIDQALDYSENRINKIPYLAEVEFRRLWTNCVDLDRQILLPLFNLTRSSSWLSFRSLLYLVL